MHSTPIGRAAHPYWRKRQNKSRSWNNRNWKWVAYCLIVFIQSLFSNRKKQTQKTMNLKIQLGPRWPLFLRLPLSTVPAQSPQPASLHPLATTLMFPGPGLAAWTFNFHLRYQHPYPLTAFTGIFLYETKEIMALSQLPPFRGFSRN